MLLIFTLNNAFTHLIILKLKSLQASMNRPVGTSIFLCHKFHLPSHINAYEVSCRIRALSSPTLKRIHPMGIINAQQRMVPPYRMVSAI